PGRDESSAENERASSTREAHRAHPLGVLAKCVENVRRTRGHGLCARGLWRERHTVRTRIDRREPGLGSLGRRRRTVRFVRRRIRHAECCTRRGEKYETRRSGRPTKSECHRRRLRRRLRRHRPMEKSIDRSGAILGSRMSSACPICKKVIEASTEEQPFRPFCSQRCKLADLDNWLSGTYRVSTPQNPSDLDDDEVKLS